MQKRLDEISIAFCYGFACHVFFYFGLLAFLCVDIRFVKDGAVAPTTGNATIGYATLFYVGIRHIMLRYAMLQKAWW